MIRRIETKTACLLSSKLLDETLDNVIPDQSIAVLPSVTRFTLTVK